MHQGSYEWMNGFPKLQQYALIIIQKLSVNGILIGAAAGCFYSELEESEEKKEKAILVIVGMTILFVLTLFGSMQVIEGFSMAYLMRMGSYFIFPMAVIFFLKKMKERNDVGGHLAYFWLVIILNIIYISLFQKSGELLMPFLIYQTILEFLFIRWIFREERDSQIMLYLSMLTGNIFIYNWYQGKIEFLQRFPTLGHWKISWTVENFGILMVMLIIFILMVIYTAKLERQQQLLLLSSCWGALWEILLKSGADGLFYMQASWQMDQSVFVIVPFVAVYLSRKLIAKREKADVWEGEEELYEED